MKKPPIPLDPSRDDVVVDTDGKTVPMSAIDIRQTVLRMLEKGRLIAVVAQDPNGDIGVQVFGPPSEELVGILEQATQGYRDAMKRHKH